MSFLKMIPTAASEEKQKKKPKKFIYINMNSQCYQVPFEEVQTWQPTSRGMGLEETLNQVIGFREFFNKDNVILFVEDDRARWLPRFWNDLARAGITISITIRTYNVFDRRDRFDRFDRFGRSVNHKRVKRVHFQ